MCFQVPPDAKEDEDWPFDRSRVGWGGRGKPIPHFLYILDVRLESLDQMTNDPVSANPSRTNLQIRRQLGTTPTAHIHPQGETTHKCNLRRYSTVQLWLY